MTAKHAARTSPRRRSAWRPLALATVGGAVLVATGIGVWATLSATATTVDPQQVTDGTLKLTMAAKGAGFSQAITNLAPGDVVNRYVDLTNGGSLDAQALALKVTGTGANALTNDATRGLRVTVTDCVNGTWTTTTGACSGTKSVLVSDKAVSDLGAGSTMISGAVAAGEAHGLQVSVRLPDQTENTVNGTLPANTIQGLSTNLTYTFTETQRTATTTNS
jgi:camelysin-like metallo-endopeptidase